MESLKYKQEGFEATPEVISISEKLLKSSARPGTIDNKFKELLPEETIKNVKSFFESLDGFSIKEVADYDTGIGVFSCTIKLYYGGKEMGLSNGKGTSYLFSRASAYAELYERFCLLYFFSDPMCLTELHFKDQRKLPISELIDSYSPIKRTDKRNVLHKSLSYLYGEEIPAVPFSRLTGGAPYYASPLILINLDGSNGMAAGNTLEEALVQGFSELMERSVEERIFYGENILEKVSDDLLKTSAPEVFQKVLAMKEKGYDISFYDASRCTGLPVMVSLCLDRKRARHYVNVGSCPMFSIAVERTLTETFQGVGNIENVPIKFIDNFAFVDASKQAYEQFTMNGIQSSSESPYIHAGACNNVNTDVYLKDGTNAKMLEKIKEIAQRNMLNLYYRDFSLCDNIKAVWCYCPELGNVLIKDSEDISNKELENLNKLEAFLKKETHSYSECIKLLGLLDYGLPVHSRVLCDKFYYSPVKGCLIDYLKFAIYIKLGEYKEAEKIGVESLNALAKDCSTINHIRSFLSYKTMNYAKEDLQKYFSLWEMPKDLLEILNEDGDKLDKLLIYDMFYGSQYNKNIKNSKEVLAKVQRIINKP